MLQKHIFQHISGYKLTNATAETWAARGNKLFVCVGRLPLFFPLVRFVAPRFLSLCALGVLARFLAAVKTAPGKILSWKDQETLCAPGCVYPFQAHTQT